MNKSKALPAIILLFWLGGIFLYAQNNLGYLGLWWDETAQFWVSLGVGHYAEPEQVPQGLASAMKFNRTQNLDPGGFTVLEHYWTKISQDIVWIRSLPFLFFLCLSFFLALLAWYLSRSPLMLVIGICVPLAYPAALYFGMENRAYSMEMAGIACGLLSLLRALEKKTYVAFLLLGSVSALFLTSRYSYVFFIAAVCCTLLYKKPADWRGREFANWLKLCAAFLVPVCVVGSIVFYYMLRHQLWPEMTAGLVGVAAPVYTKSSVLLGNPNYVELLVRNLVSLPALPITVAIVYVLFLQRPLYRLLNSRCSDVYFDARFAVVYVFILFFQIISLVASLAGAYPWDIQARWSANLLAVSMIAFVTILVEVIVLLRTSGLLGVVYERWGGLRPALTVLLTTGLIYFTSIQAATYLLAEKSPRVNVSLQVDQLRNLPDPAKLVFVTYYEVPMIRYLYEYGPMRNAAEYPSIFLLETGAQFRRQGPIDRSAAPVEYIISSHIKARLQARFPKNRLIEVGSDRSSLLRVADQTAAVR